MIDNIFVNNADQLLASGNIISNVSDYFFAVLYHVSER